MPPYSGGKNLINLASYQIFLERSTSSKWVEDDSLTVHKTISILRHEIPQVKSAEDFCKAIIIITKAMIHQSLPDHEEILFHMETIPDRLVATISFRLNKKNDDLNQQLDNLFCNELKGIKKLCQDLSSNTEFFKRKTTATSTASTQVDDANHELQLFTSGYQ